MHAGRGDKGRAALSLRLGATLVGIFAVVLSNVWTSAGSDPMTGRGATGRSYPAAVAASQYLVLTATSLDAFGLTYAGKFTVPRGTGTVQVLRFTFSHGSLAGMRSTEACSGGITTVTTTAGASLSSTTFDVVKLVATVAGTPLTFTVANPPTTPFPNHLLMQQLTTTATTLSATTLNAPSLFTRALAC